MRGRQLEMRRKEEEVWIDYTTADTAQQAVTLKREMFRSLFFSFYSFFFLSLSLFCVMSSYTIVRDCTEELAKAPIQFNIVLQILGRRGFRWDTD